MTKAVWMFFCLIFPMLGLAEENITVSPTTSVKVSPAPAGTPSWDTWLEGRKDGMKIRADKKARHEKDWKLVYGDNFEHFKILAHWYGHHPTLPGDTTEASIAWGKTSAFTSEQKKDYCDRLKKRYRLECLEKKFTKRYHQPIYSSPSVKSSVVGVWTNDTLVSEYMGEVIVISNPLEFERGRTEIATGFTRGSYIPVLDYRILTEDGVEREWMRLPTMGRPGEIWVATDPQGYFRYFDLQRAPQEYLGVERKPGEEGLINFSNFKLARNYCLDRIENGNLFLKRFFFPMRFSTTNGYGGGDVFAPGKVPALDMALVESPKGKEWIEETKHYPVMEFKHSFMEFAYEFGELDESTIREKVILPGDNAGLKSCTDLPDYAYHKRLPKDKLPYFYKKYKFLSEGKPGGSYEADVLRGEGRFANDVKHYKEAIQFNERDSMPSFWYLMDAVEKEL